MLAVIVAGVLWYNSRPRPQKPWNTRAIKATYDSLVAEDDDGYLVFYYVLENTTDADYRVQESSANIIVARLKTENSLTPPIVKKGVGVSYPIFVPAKQRGLYSSSLPPFRYPGGKLKDDARKEERHAYSKAISAYVNEKFSNLDGFVLFDETNRDEINFPKGW